MRVISGALKGKRLFSVKGLDLRPTSDRVREAIFDILQGSFDGAKVLDLFAGTGAMGIEALSRGAISAVFVEKSPQSLSALQRNLVESRLQKVSQVLPMAVEEGILFLASREEKFDFVFLDPPYGQGLMRMTLEALSTGSILNSEALVIAEHSLAEEVEEVRNLKRTDFRKYGRTRVSFFRAE